MYASLPSIRSLTILLLLLGLMGLRPAGAENWTSSRQVRAVCAWHGAVWAATGGGLLQVDPATSRVTKLTPAEGLPETDVLDVRPWGGRLVVGARRSLGLYDGSRWQVLPALPQADAGQAPAMGIAAGRLFAAAGGGVFRLTEGATLTWETVPAPEPVHFLGDAGGQLWLTGAKGIWSSADGASWQRAGDALGEAPFAVTAAGDWVALGSRGAVYVRNGATWTRVDLTTLPGATHLAGLSEAGGRLLLCVYGSGLWTLDPQHPERGPVRHPSAAPADLRSAPLALQGLWLGTTAGLRRWNGKAWSTLTVANEPPGKGCVALARYGGALWLATGDGGVARFTRGRWEAGTGPERSHVLRLAAGGDRLWARHPDGTLSYYTGNAWHPFRPNAQDRLTWASGLWSTPGGVWIGTWAGASRLSGSTREDWFGAPLLEGEPVTAVAEHRGEVWLGTARHGLAVRGADRGWSAFHEGNGLPDGWITALASDGERLWAGTFNGGLAVWDGKGWSYPQPIASAAGRKITCLAVDREGGVWVGTHAGVVRFAHGKWRVWTQAQGLAGDEIQCLQPEDGATWVGTRTGLSQLALEQ